MADHAPGPWKRSETIFPAVEDATGKRVCMCHVNTRTTAEMEANCRLAAAAPSMLEACQAFLKAWRAFLDDWQDRADYSTNDLLDALEFGVIQKVMEAVEQATGGSP